MGRRRLEGRDALHYGLRRSQDTVRHHGRHSSNGDTVDTMVSADHKIRSRHEATNGLNGDTTRSGLTTAQTEVRSATMVSADHKIRSAITLDTAQMEVRSSITGGHGSNGGTLDTTVGAARTEIRSRHGATNGLNVDTTRSGLTTAQTEVRSATMASADHKIRLPPRSARLEGDRLPSRAALLEGR